MSAAADEGIDADARDKASAIVRQILDNIPQIKALGARFLRFGPSWIELELPYAPHLVGFPETGVVAGGAIYTLMDNACGFAVSAAKGGWVPTATIDLRIDYLKPATPGLTIIGRAEAYKLTRKIAFVRGTAYHDDPARAIAHVTGTFFIAGPPMSAAQRAAHG
jgi:uncharacterized protein (TIGR00369 family)